MVKHSHLPKYNELLNPLVQALRDLGGLGSIDTDSCNGFAL